MARLRWFQTNIRNLLIIIAVIAVPVAYKVNRVRSKRLAVDEINRCLGILSSAKKSPFLGVGSFMVDVPQSGLSTSPQEYSPYRSFVSDGEYDEIDTVQFYVPGRVTDNTLRKLTKLSNIETLSICGDVSSHGLCYLTSLRKLKDLTFHSDCRITDDDLRYFQPLKGVGQLKGDILALSKTSSRES